jgi:hypothetical protein
MPDVAARRLEILDDVAQFLLENCPPVKDGCVDEEAQKSNILGHASPLSGIRRFKLKFECFS